MRRDISSTNAALTSPLYARLLGAEWAQLDETLRRAHLQGDRLCLSGTFQIRRGESWLARVVARILRLPATSEAVAARLTVLPTASGEKWIRRFGDSELMTTQTAAADGTMRERFRIIEISCRLEATSGAITYRQVGAALRLGRLHVAGLDLR